MAEIIPAIMPMSLEDLREKLAQVDGLVSLVQGDVMDGLFVPNRSWPFTEGGLDEFARIIAEEDGLPFWNTLNFEVDLMVSSPETAIAQWFSAGARRFIVHIESVADFAEVVDFFDTEIRAEDETAELGIALNPDTSNGDIEPFLESVDFVQCMGIAHIGFQGEPFDERGLEKKIKELEVKANLIRQTIIEMLVAAGSGHTAGPLGMADIFTAFYFHILN